MKLKLFCVLVAGSAFACAQPQATVNQPVVLEVRFVDTTPGSDTIWRPLRGGFDTIALSPDAIFTGADLSEVRADTSRHWSLLSPRIQTINEITLRLKPDGALRLRQATASAIGEQMAVVVNGEVVSRPVIREPISGPEVVLAGDFTEDEVRDLAERLNQIPLR